MSDRRPNIPVPDELATVRAQIRTLEEREAVLKQLILTDPELRTGNNFAAEIQEVTTTRVDIKELRAMHEDLVGEYTFPQKTVRIMLREISEDGELLSFRRKARL